MSTHDRTGPGMPPPTTGAATSRWCMRLAWLAVLAAVPLRLYFFYGYGLGDDVNFATTALNLLDTGHLDFRDHHTNRLLMLIPQLVAFRALPVSDLSFVMPILVFSLGTHVLTLLFVRDLLGAPAAAAVSLFILATPFETLTATAFIPDCILAFYTVAFTWSAYRGYVRRSRAAMVLAGVCLAATPFVKMAATLLLPVVGLAILLGRRFLRGWLTLGLSAVATTALVSVLFWRLAGHPLHWFFHRAVPPWGHDVTGQIWATVSLYPRYLFWTDPDYGGWLFGITAYVALAGGIVAAVAAVRYRRVEAVVVVLMWVYILLFNFAPHKLDLRAYYSHPRIFRYVAQVSPFVYVSAAFFIATLWRRGAVGRTAAVALTALVGVVGLLCTSRATEPSWDSSADGRWLSALVRQQGPLPHANFHCDYWYCERLRDMHYPASKEWRVRSASADSEADKAAFLRQVEEGYVVTGGAGLPWYSSHLWLLNLSELDFQPPPTWTLLAERDGLPRPWRVEPLRLWYVGDPREDQPIFIPDEGLRRCVRAQALAADAARETPLTRRLARRTLHIECPDANITDVRGLEHFTDLRVLNLANNAVREIDLAPFREARVLILGVNEIERVTGLEHLTALETLWLGANRLTSLDVRGLRELKDLRLDDNRLRSVQGLENLSRLELLFLGKNPDLDCSALDLPPRVAATSGCGD